MNYDEALRIKTLEFVFLESSSSFCATIWGGQHSREVEFRASQRSASDYNLGAERLKSVK